MKELEEKVKYNYRKICRDTTIAAGLAVTSFPGVFFDKMGVINSLMALSAGYLAGRLVFYTERYYTQKPIEDVLK